MKHQSQTSGAGDWLAGAVKSNPEGFLLLAAGCALLLRSGSTRASSNRYSSPSYGDERQHANRGDARLSNVSSEVSDSVTQAAETARQYAADVGKTVSQTASSYASAVGDYADDARRTIVNQSEQFVEQARSTVQGTISRVLQEQPLALALVGLAAGAAVAAALPATAVERRTLGPTGERLSEAAASVGENLTQAASKAGEKLMNVAEERGLNAKGLKEVAGDVAGAFGNALSGEHPTDQSLSSGNQRQLPSDSMSRQGGSNEFGTSYGQGGQASSPGTSSASKSYGQAPSGATPTAQPGGIGEPKSNPGQGSNQSGKYPKL